MNGRGRSGSDDKPVELSPEAQARLRALRSMGFEDDDRDEFAADEGERDDLADVPGGVRLQKVLAAAGVATVLRRLRDERERSAVDEAADRDVPSTSSAIRMVALLFTGPVVVMGWWLASHAQTNPSGGFQGGVVLATAFVLIYLSGEFLVFKKFSPVDLTDVVEAVGAGGFAAIGVSAVAMGLPYLTDFLPLGTVPGAVSSSGTIALISFFVGVEVAAAFILIVGELVEQTLLVRQGDH